MEALPLAAAMLGGVDVSAQVVLSLTGDFEQHVAQYQCEGMEPFDVTFINASPNFLAIVPIGGQKLVFVHVLSADGARYAAGQYEFWTRGNSATLTDLQATPQTPASCEVVTDTP
ncbi:MAG TPA: MliC family protein [Alphaproteobacteria bacterium]|nr:MliC family protein [Alphaproteobacteria bacterium]